MFEIAVASECYSKRQVRMQNRDIFPIFYNMKVYYVFSLESPHRGDSNKYTKHSIFNINNTLIYPKSAAMGFFYGTQERVRNSRGKRASSVRATEASLYFYKILQKKERKKERKEMDCKR